MAFGKTQTRSKADDLNSVAGTHVREKERNHSIELFSDPISSMACAPLLNTSHTPHSHTQNFFKNTFSFKSEIGEMVWQLRVFTVLAEDQNLVFSRRVTFLQVLMSIPCWLVSRTAGSLN